MPFIASSESPDYGRLLAAVIRGDARYLGEHISPRGVKEIAVEFGREQNPEGDSLAGGFIGISTRFFSTILKEYDQWREKWWREAIQNAVDAGATKITCEVRAQSDGTAVVACQDNGRGMTEDTLRNKFLMLGGTTKPGESGMAGGFGKAKELLILPWLRWRVQTRDLVAEGVPSFRDPYSLERAKQIDGTRLEVVMPADQQTDLVNARDFLNKSHLPRIKFELLRVDVDGTEHRQEVKATMRVGSLMAEVPGRAEIYATKVPYNTWNMLVRVKGIYMFSHWVGETKGHQMICEITAPSVDVLQANRDGFVDHDVERMVGQVTRNVAQDVLSAFRSKSGLLREKYSGTGKFTAAARAADAVARMGAIEPTTRGQLELDDDAVNRLSDVVGQWEQVLSMESGAEPGVPGRGLAAALLRGTSFRGAHHVEQAVEQLVWQPDFYLTNEIEGYKVPRRFRPATMTPRVIKLVRTWTELCRYVLMQLGEFRPFGVGLVFSEDYGATYSNDDKENWLLLNPFVDPRERKAIWSPTKKDDLKWLYAAAVHECTHMADGISVHNEVFAAALTRNIAKTADGFRHVRRIVREIRMSERPIADVASNPARRQALSWGGTRSGAVPRVGYHP